MGININQYAHTSRPFSDLTAFPLDLCMLRKVSIYEHVHLVKIISLKVRGKAGWY